MYKIMCSDASYGNPVYIAYITYKANVGWLVGWLVGWSVGRSVGRLVGWLLVGICCKGMLDRIG
jgi:hypothetical protein